MARRNANVVEYRTETVFAAACAAHRVNGGYFKSDVNLYDEDGEFVRTDKVANKFLLRKFLNGDFDIIDQDREMAEKVIKYCHGLSFKIIQGKNLSDFEQAMLTIAEKSVISSNYDLAVISSLPASYERSIARVDVDVRLRDARGGFLGQVGDKVEITMEVLRCNYSKTWEIFYVTGITTDDKVVFFSSKNAVEINKTFKIKGRVKAHKEDRTQLSHAKVL